MKANLESKLGKETQDMIELRVKQELGAQSERFAKEKEQLEHDLTNRI